MDSTVKLLLVRYAPTDSGPWGKPRALRVAFADEVPCDWYDPVAKGEWTKEERAAQIRTIELPLEPDGVNEASPADNSAYYDLDGNPCSLDRLCVLEPAWAANRIRVMSAALRSRASTPEGKGADVDDNPRLAGPCAECGGHVEAMQSYQSVNTDPKKRYHKRCAVAVAEQIKAGSAASTQDDEVERVARAIRETKGSWETVARAVVQAMREGSKT